MAVVTQFKFDFEELPLLRVEKAIAGLVDGTATIGVQHTGEVMLQMIEIDGYIPAVFGVHRRIIKEEGALLTFLPNHPIQAYWEVVAVALWQEKEEEIREEAKVRLKEWQAKQRAGGSR